MKKQEILLLIALMFMTVLVFFPALQADFVNLDDRIMIAGNWKIKSLSHENIKALLFEPHYKLYHPLVSLSYAVQYRFSGADPYFYHAGNLILHLFNTLFVFFIFFRLTDKNFMISFITVLIFACHPMHVEPVAWVSGRKDTLYAFFFLSSWLMYLKAYSLNGKKRIFALLFSLFLFLCACLSKTMAVTLPAVLILCDWLAGKNFDRKTVLKYLPYIAAAIIFSLSTYALYYTSDQKTDFTPYTLFLNFISAHFNVLFYMAKFVFPSKLSAIYPYFFDGSAAAPSYILRSPALLYGMVLLIIYSLKRTKALFFGFTFFIITILPVINILPTGISPVADRYTYIPFIGFGYIAATAAAYVYNAVNKQYWRAAVIVIISVLSLVMFSVSQRKAEKWLTTKTLFDDIISNYPADIAYAHSYAVRGLWYKENMMYEEAEKDLNIALFFDKESNLSIYSLAGIMKDKGKYKEALALYESLPKDDINIASAYMYSANIYYEHMNDPETAHKIVEKALKYFPNDFFLHITLGSFYKFEEKFDKAEESFKRAKKIYPDNIQSYMQLAQLYDETGRPELAVKEYAEAARSCGEDFRIYNKLGIMNFKAGSYDSAEKIFRHAVKLNPGNYEAYDYLGNIYAINKNYKKALYYFTLSILNNKNHAPAYFHRAAVHLETGRYIKASEDADRVKKLGADIPEEFKEEMKEKSGIIL